MGSFEESVMLEFYVDFVGLAGRAFGHTADKSTFNGNSLYQHVVRFF